MADEEALRQRLKDDEKLIRRAEKALTEIKVAEGLSEEHAGIRLKGEAGKSLEDLISAAGDLGKPHLDELMSEEKVPKKRSLDDVLQEKPKPKPEWPAG